MFEFGRPVRYRFKTREALGRYADAVGDIDLSNEQARSENAIKVARMIQLIVSTREYQFA